MLPIRWKDRIRAGEIVRLVGAHDSLSAIIAGHSDCDGIWWGSFGLSLSHGVPDRSLISPTDIALILAHASRKVHLPHIVDGDAGYGGLEQLAEAYRTYRQVGATGICIEDNQHPKICSLEQGAKRQLCSVCEMCDRVRHLRKCFGREPCIIARTETLLISRSVEDALYRSAMYARAGADAIVVHNNNTTIDSLWRFAERWQEDVPLVAIPTTYGHVQESALLDHGFAVVIYANVLVRSAVKAMSEVLATLQRTKNLDAVEDNIAPIDYAYGLVDTPLLDLNSTNL